MALKVGNLEEDVPVPQDDPSAPIVDNELLEYYRLFESMRVDQSYEATGTYSEALKFRSAAYRFASKIGIKFTTRITRGSDDDEYIIRIWRTK